MKLTMEQTKIISTLPKVEENSPVISITVNIQHDSVTYDREKLVFKNFIKDAKELITTEYSTQIWRLIEKNIKANYEEQIFWERPTSGVLVIISANYFKVFPLPFELKERLLVDTVPLVLPLIEHEQLFSHYEVLLLSRDRIRLVDMNHQKATEVKLPEEAPTTIKEALGEELTGGNLNFTRSGGGADSTSYHGLNAKEEEIDKDMRNYFQLVDRYISENYSKLKERPLILFTLPENRGLFEKLSQNPYLIKGISIEASPAELSEKDIEKQILSVDKKWRQLMLDELLADYNRGYREEKVTHFYDDIDTAAKEARIFELWLAVEEAYSPDTIKKYNRIAYDTIKGRGMAFIMPQAWIPEQSPFIGIVRY